VGLPPIQAEQAALERFIGLLQQEQRALVKADVTQLTTLSETKLKLAEQLQALSQARMQALADAGYSSDAEGMRRWLAGQPAGTAQAWERLLEQARDAQRLNQSNGKLITTHLQHNQQALATLINAANQAGMYGPDGQLQAGAAATTRTLGKV